MHAYFFSRGCGHHHFGRRHHRGFQGFGFGPGQMFGSDSGRSGLGAGRKLSAGDLQLLILSLLAERAQHGYEIIKSIGERSNGFYSPSPGMVYPALTYLEEIGHASVEVEGTKKRYSITDEGVAYLEKNRAAADTLLEQLAWIGQRMDRVRRAFDADDAMRRDDPEADFDGPLRERGRGRGRGDDDRDDLAAGVRRARRSLKSALIAKLGASVDEQRRIAEILERAAREIRGD